MKQIKSKYWIDKFAGFSIEGDDSKKFLNGITTSNIISNTKNIVQTCWLTPTGVLRAVLEIHNINNESNRLLILVLMGDIDALRKYCKDFTFPSDDVKVGDIRYFSRIQEINHINNWREFIPELLDEINHNDYSFKNKLEFIKSYDLKEWQINQGIPRFGYEINGKNNPLELGLVDLIDFNKGCYLGQETMAKLKNVSILKQEIRVWFSRNALENLRLKDNRIFFDMSERKTAGFITSCQKLRNKNYQGLVMVKKQYLEESIFYSDELGQINTNKSIGSAFL